MPHPVEQATENQTNLLSLESKTLDMRVNTEEMEGHSRAVEKKMWWNSQKMPIAIVAVLLVR